MMLFKSTVPLSKFTPHVIVATFDQDGNNPIPESVAESFVRNSAISFAEKTGIITTKIKVDLQCGMSEYPLEVRDCDTIIGVKSASLNEFESEDCGFGWTWGDISFRLNDDVLEIYPAPSEDVLDGLSLELVIVPDRDACEIDAQFYDKWFDAIINGALAELHMIPSRPFSSTTRAEQRRRMFNEDVGRATVRRVLQGHREPMRITGNSNWQKCRTRQRRF